MNLVDVATLGYVAIYVLFAFRRGFIRLTLDLAALVGSIVLAYVSYHRVGSIIASLSHLPSQASLLIGFFAALIAAQILLGIAARLLAATFIPAELRDSRLNRWLGVVPAVVTATFLAAILLSVAYALPLPASWRDQIGGGAVSGPIVTGVQSRVGDLISGPIKGAVDFLTIEPQGEQSIKLGYTTTKVAVDASAEQKMWQLLNKERTSRGLAPLALDTGKLQQVARDHSRDMFARGYFAHNDPDGNTPFDRMRKAGVSFLAAGENLALAPNVDVAHQGLMNSPPHRANILDPSFHRVGIGVIDGGLHGEMFSQEFTN